MAKSLLVHCVCILCFLIAAAWSRVQAQEAPQPAPVPVPVPAPSSNQTRPRAFFVFGDSLVDSGNNNFLASTARADMPPYGIDFPSHEPTGRFSNGYNIPDLISLRIGSEPTMPYLHPDLHGEKLLIGANFASAGVGILNDTGVQFVVVMRIWQQFEMFEQYKVRVRELIGAEKAEKLVKESLVLISLGGNDFVNNYFLLPITARSRQYALPAYVTLLISEYRNILKRMYEMGPGRIIVTGTGPLGCVPAELAIWSSDGECAAQLQQAAELFNPLLLEMIKDLNNQLPTGPHHHVFVAANALDINMDFIKDPHSFGFNTSKEACCGQGPYNGMGICTPISRLCQDRNSHVFWDAFHPTEKANRLIVNEIMTGSQQFMHPMNLSTIMALDSF